MRNSALQSMMSRIYASQLTQRLVQSVFVLFGVSALIFFIARVIPGDPARLALGPNASPEQVASLREQLNLDEPALTQYFLFLRDLFHGDLGISLYSGRPVVRDILEQLPATVELVLFSAVIMIVAGVVIGAVATRYQNRAADYIIRVLSLAGIVVPSFVWAIVLMLILAFWLDLLPIAGRLSQGMEPPRHITGLYTVDALLTGNIPVFFDAIYHIALPAFALSIASISQESRLMRASLVETMSAPFIETARAYGRTESWIIRKWAMRPALVPALTVVGLDIASKIGNAFLIEAVFAWPGIARYGVEVILFKDLNAIIGTVLVISLAFILINIIVDFLVGLVYPKIRLQGATDV
ncbi:peptide/nickel transport system permease protein [Shimia aestuarii]|uniref:Peptide/nickel transport system permease protein n=2 Tax=Shimia aestuarii TaxID=254406 RepID=A0A1I4SMX2_9RHOB|nr:peptide/nickel transport system permease protein [Shimia aestuarii]